MKRLLVLSVVAAAAVAAAVLLPLLADGKKPDKEYAAPAGFQKLTYEEALDRAKSEKKVVMIDFYADWCGPCKLLDAETFSTEKVRKFLKEKTVAIKVDVDTHAHLANKYKIRSIPCLVFLDGEGKEVGRLVGFYPADKFLEEAREVVK